MLITAALEQKFPLVLFAPLQVCSVFYSLVKYSLIRSFAVPLVISDSRAL